MDNITKLFVSKPIRNEFLGPVYATDGAIDLTVVDCNGKESDMGMDVCLNKNSRCVVEIHSNDHCTLEITWICSWWI